MSVCNISFLRPVYFIFTASIRTVTPCRELCNKSSAVAEMGDRLATIDTGRKVGAAVRLSVGELRPHLTMSPGPRPTTVQNGILIHPTVWPQYTNATDKQDRQGNGPVAWGEPLGLLVTVGQKR